MNWTNVGEAAIAGLVASVVYAGMGWGRDYWSRPIFRAHAENVRAGDDGKLAEFDLVFENIGGTAFQEPCLNVALPAHSVEINSPDADPARRNFPSWSGDRTRAAYFHQRAFVPDVPIRFQLKVLDRAQLPASVGIRLEHSQGVALAEPLSLSDLERAAKPGTGAK